MQYMNSYKLENGTYLTDSQGKKREKVALIGYQAAIKFFGEDLSDVIGKRIKLNGRQFEVKGIIKRVGDSTEGSTGGGDMGRMMGGSIDDSFFIPYELGIKYIAGNRSRSSYSVQAKDINSVQLAMTEIKDFLKKTLGDSEAYSLMDAGSRLSSAQGTAKTMSTLLTSVATIVLIVGGIGIMNVLLVSVKERTREIGILKSIGAKRSDILLEFLFESIFISITGGLVGSLLSYAVMPFLKYVNLTVIPSVYGVGLGIGFSVITGTFFGFYPASKASKLKPIEALNYE